MITILREVLGPENVPSYMRHVRDLWNASEGSDLFIRKQDPGVGDMVVLARYYTVHGQELTVPGHVGVVSAIGQSGIELVHATSGEMPGGQVEEGPLSPTEVALGYISLAGY